MLKVGKLRFKGDNKCGGLQWNLLTDRVTSLIQKKNPIGMWYCEMKNFGWREVNASAYIKANNGKELLTKLLPETECDFNIFNYGQDGMAIQNYHHDSPTGKEMYLLRRATFKERKEHFNFS